MRKEPVFYQFCAKHEAPVILYPTVVRQPFRSSILMCLEDWTIRTLHFLLYYLTFQVKRIYKLTIQKVFLNPISKAWTGFTTVLYIQPKLIPENNPYYNFGRKCPAILFKLEDLASAALLAAPIKSSISAMKATADAIVLVNNYIQMAIQMAYDVTVIFAGVFQNLQLVTKNIALSLSLIDYIVRSIAMIQYFVSVFIHGFSYLSSYLAKLRQNPAWDIAYILFLISKNTFKTSEIKAEDE